MEWFRDLNAEKNGILGIYTPDSTFLGDIPTKESEKCKNIKALKLNKLTHLAALKKVKSIIGESLDQYKVFSMFFELPKTM